MTKWKSSGILNLAALGLSGNSVLAMCDFTYYLTSLSPIFLICKMWKLFSPVSQGRYEHESDTCNSGKMHVPNSIAGDSVGLK